MIRADFQGMESVSEFKMNSVTENYSRLCSSNGNMTLSYGYNFQSLS